MPQADPSGDRGCDVAVDNLQLGSVDCRLVGLHRSHVLADRCHLRIEGLLRDGIGDDQLLIACQVLVALHERGLVLRQLTFGLRLLHLVKPRVDLDERIAGLDHLPFGVKHLHDFAVDPGLDDVSLQGRHRPQARQVHIHVAFADGRRDDRDRPLRLPRDPFLGGLEERRVLDHVVAAPAGRNEQEQNPNPRPALLSQLGPKARIVKLRPRLAGAAAIVEIRLRPRLHAVVGQLLNFSRLNCRHTEANLSRKD